MKNTSADWLPLCTDVLYRVIFKVSCFRQAAKQETERDNSKVQLLTRTKGCVSVQLGLELTPLTLFS